MFRGPERESLEDKESQQIARLIEVTTQARSQIDYLLTRRLCTKEVLKACNYNQVAEELIF